MQIWGALLTAAGAAGRRRRLFVEMRHRWLSSDHFRIRLSTGYDSGDKLLTRGNIQTH